MSEFSAAANLSLRVADSELRSARQKIERELGGVDVGTMRPDGGRPVGAGAGAARGQRAGILDATRKNLGATEELVALAEERNEILDDMGGVGGGGGGGGATTFLSGLGARSVLGGLGGAGLGIGGAGVGLAGAGAVGTLGLMMALFGHGNGTFRSGDLVGPSSPADNARSTGSGNNLFEAIGSLTSGISVPEPTWLESLLNWNPPAPGIGQPGATSIDGRTGGGEVDERRHSRDTGMRLNVNANVAVESREQSGRDLEKRISDRVGEEVERQLRRSLDRVGGGPTGSKPRTYPGGWD